MQATKDNFNDTILNARFHPAPFAVASGHSCAPRLHGRFECIILYPWSPDEDGCARSTEKFMKEEAGSSLYPRLMRKIKFTAKKVGATVPDRWCYEAKATAGDRERLARKAEEAAAAAAEAEAEGEEGEEEAPAAE